MVRFVCSTCAYGMDVPDEFAGKQARCPKCKAPNIVGNAKASVPAQAADLIKFYCPHCRKKIGVKLEYAGRRVKCAHCKNPITIPNSSQPQPKAAIPEVAAPQPQLPGDMFSNHHDLLALEKQGTAVDMPERSFEADAAEAVTAVPQTMSQQKKFPKKKVLIIAGAAVCVIAVLALVISVVGSFRAVKESAAPRAQNNDANDFALKCIGQLAKGDVNGVWLQLTQELQTQPNKELLKQMSEALGQAPKGDYVGSATHIMKDKQGIIYWYDYSIGPDNKQEMTVFVRQQRSDLVVEGLSLSFRDEDKMPIMMESSLCQKVYEDSAQSVFGAILGLAKTMFVVLIILAVVTTISEAIVFSKADEPAIAAFVPFYRYWVLARVGDRPGALGLATCFVSAIPYVGWLIAVGLFIYICIGIAAAFGRGILFGLGLCFLPFIFYPILAFSQK